MAAPAGIKVRDVRRRLATVVACCVVVVTGQASAFTIAFDARPKILNAGETGEAVFTLSGIGNAPVPQLPQPDGLRVQRNPARGQNTSWVNGKTSRTLSFTYRFLGLQPGKHQLAPPPYTADGETHRFTPITVEVVARSEDGSPTSMEDVLFARLTTDRDRVYIQEAFEIVLSVYSRGLSLGQNFGLGGLPDSGLDVQDFRQLPATRDTINGAVYDVRRFRSRVRALTAGTFTVEPTVTVPVVVKQQNRRHSIFDMMWDGSRTQAAEVKTDPLVVEVLPLPQDGRPATFSGAVGTFTFDVQAKPLKLQAGEPLTITMQISGRGNLDSVSAPTLDLGSAFKTYDPRLLSKEMNDSETLGRKVFEQVVIPRSEEVTELPPIAFSFFDPAGEIYRTVPQGPFALEVTPSTGQVSRVVEPAADAATPSEDVVRRDIVYLKHAPRSWRPLPDRPWFLHPLFLGVQFLPPLGALACIAVVRRRKALRTDVAKARRLRAPRAARSGLEAASSALQRGDHAGFYEAAWDTLGSYFSDRLNLAPGEVSATTVIAAMESAGMESREVTQLRDLFMVCEHARFGLSGETEATVSDDDERNARRVMDLLESVMKGAERVRVEP